MISQNVYIINNDSLYEILCEIKENLPFNIISFEDEDSFINNLNLDFANSIIISKFMLMDQSFKQTVITIGIAGIMIFLAVLV